MLDGLFMLLSLSIVMALASFLAGALPLSMSLSSSQLRLISTIGMGVLVGTSLIVIIPEGIEAIYTSGEVGHIHTRKNLQARNALEMRWIKTGVHALLQHRQEEDSHGSSALPGSLQSIGDLKIEALGTTTTPSSASEEPKPPSETDTSPSHAQPDDEHHSDPPTFYIGFSLITGFILMYLIDKLPRHAADHVQPPPATRHISLSNLSLSASEEPDPEAESFLQSLTPSPKQTRSLATTTGLVIHASADGIAMGASVTSSNTSLGFVIFIAIMIHKAPAAFGLTSVLLKQGLSKRAARGHLIVFSLAAPIGALTTWLLVTILGGDHMEGERGQWWTGMLLLFSAGTFLYVAMHAMQEDSSSDHSHSASNGYTDGGMGMNNGAQRKAQKPQMRDTFAAVGGMLVPLLTQLGHHH